MPKELPIPAAVASLTRHCTALQFDLPIGGEVRLTASFTELAKDKDGNTLWSEPESSITLTQAEIMALPAFAAAYGQLAFAVHAKRNLHDPAT